MRKAFVAIRRRPSASSTSSSHCCHAKFTRQKPLGFYIADFYCSSERLVIELDGDSHFDDKAEGRDAARTAALEALGLRVIRFRNDELKDSFEAVCEKIRAALKT